MLVDVVVKMHQPILGNNHRSIYDEHGDRVSERHLLCRRPIHRGANAINVPARIIAEDPCRQVDGVFQPDAAVAKVAL